MTGRLGSGKRERKREKAVGSSSSRVADDKFLALGELCLDSILG